VKITAENDQISQDKVDYKLYQGLQCVRG